MRFSKYPKTLQARKAIRKTPTYIVKLVFSYVLKGIKIKTIAKFRDTEHLRFEDTKRIMSPEKFRDFRETGPGGLDPNQALVTKILWTLTLCDASTK